MASDRRHPLPEELSRAIISQLASGRFKPGERLSAIAIAKSLGVSTTPIREALNRLAGSDLIEERHREGFYVAPLSGRTIAALYALHGMGIALALSRLGRDRPRRVPSDIWGAFQSLTHQTGDIALIGVQHYLAGRLRLVRRLEVAHVDGFAEITAAFVQATRKGKTAELPALAERFHTNCQATAAIIADRYSDAT